MSYTLQNLTPRTGTSSSPVFSRISLPAIWTTLRRSTATAEWRPDGTATSYRLRAQPDCWRAGLQALHWRRSVHWTRGIYVSFHQSIIASTYDSAEKHCTYRSEEQVQNDHKKITLKEKTWCPVHLKIRQVQGNLLQCFQARIGWIKAHFPPETNFPEDINSFLGVVNLSSDSLTWRMLQNLFLVETEITCLMKRDLNSWSRKTKWNLCHLHQWISAGNSCSAIGIRGRPSRIRWISMRTSSTARRIIYERKSASRNSDTEYTRDGRNEESSRITSGRILCNKNWETVMTRYRDSLHKYKSCKRGWIAWVVPDNFLS